MASGGPTNVHAGFKVKGPAGAVRLVESIDAGGANGIDSPEFLIRRVGIGIDVLWMNSPERANEKRPAFTSATDTRRSVAIRPP